MRDDPYDYPLTYEPPPSPFYSLKTMAKSFVVPPVLGAMGGTYGW